MKKGTVFMKLTSALAVVLFLGGSIVSCGGGGGDDPPPVTAIKSESDAKNAASEANQATNLAAGSALTVYSLGSLGGGLVGSAAPRFKLPQSMKLTGGTAITAKLSDTFAKSAAVASATGAFKKAASLRTSIPFTTELCTDGGNYSYSGNVDDSTGNYTLTVTFSSCKEMDTETDGTLTYSGTMTPSGGTMAMAATNFSIVAYEAGSNYTTPEASILANIAFSGNVTGDMSSETVSMSGNGTIVASAAGIDYTLTYTNFSFSDRYVWGTTYDNETITVNGGVGESWTIGADTFGASISYEGYAVAIKFYNSTWDEEITINGVFTIDFTPDACFEGRYSIQTTVPLYWEFTAGHTTAGTMIINGNTAIIFNADGTITVEYEGTPIPGMVDVDELTLNGVCLIGTL